MSKYTTEVRFICESYAGLTESGGYSSVDTIISAAIPKIFDFDFPIFDPVYRNVLCTKILKHYYTREICEETVGLWKLRLNAKLNEVMPYFNKLYESERLKFEPLTDTDYTVTGNKKEDGTNDTVTNSTGTVSKNGNGTTTSNGERDSLNWELYSDTPQGSVTDLDNENYLTNATKTTNNETANNTTNNEFVEDSENIFDGTENRIMSNTEDYIEHITGKRNGDTYAKMLTEYRETFLNIDMLVIDSLSTLFFGLW